MSEEVSDIDTEDEYKKQAHRALKNRHARLTETEISAEVMVFEVVKIGFLSAEVSE